MIEINLLPAELRSKTKKVDLVRSAQQHRYLLYIIPAFFAFLLCTHIYLAIADIIKSQQLRLLNNKWQSLESRRKEVAEFKKVFESSVSDINSIQQLVNQRINCSEKLNKLSLYLPGGVWFIDLSLNQRNLVLKGSVVSMSKEELGLINSFMGSLKKDSGFFKDFNSLELSSIQRRTIGTYDIVDFILAGTLKSK
jgi:Tfp pilus assembly protein PilN